MFFKIKCYNCNKKLRRKTLECPHCSAILYQEQGRTSAGCKTLVEYCSIVLVACSCLSFVISFGVTEMYRDGGFIWGLGSLALVFISIFLVRRIEQKR